MNKSPLLVPVALWAAVSTANAASANPKPCINYYSVGPSDCRPSASTPVAQPAVAQPELLTPTQKKTEVDKYLENYGKPPREFVEFYLNPTAENAQKWASAYQQLMKKGEDLSKAWSEADQLYAAQNAPRSSQAPTSQVAEPVMQQMVAPPVSVQPVAQPAAASFGGLSDGRAQGQSAPSGIRIKKSAVTYYFSQTCPYCARMTPDLAMLSRDLGDKLELTCVDVTPLGAQSRPDEAYITSKLPCKYRLPDQGEVESQQVRQTPTLIIQTEGSAPVRLSGYVPLVQLRRYF